MRQRSNIKAGLFIALLLLTQTLLLVHSSVHALQADDATCGLCLAADNLGSSLVSTQFEFVAQPLTGCVITLPSHPYLGIFHPQSPLPRAPPTT